MDGFYVMDSKLSSDRSNLIIGGAKDSFVALHFTPDGANVKVVSKTFKASAKYVLIGAEAWKVFVDGVVELEKTRHGSSELESYEGDFRLRLYVFDRAGHVALEGDLRRLSERNELRFWFHLDPTQLPRIVKRLREVVWSGPSWVPLRTEEDS